MKLPEQLKTEVRIINSEIAKEMLKRNQRNRNCNIKHVSFLANQMKEGRWLFDGQPIRFSEDGRLLDGQHRLSAIIESNTEQQFLIVKGVKSESFKVMDTGRNRGGADVLHINGVQYSTTVASVGRVVMSFAKKNYGKISSDDKISNYAILEWYEANKGIIEIIKNADRMRLVSGSILTTSQIASFHYLFSKKNVIDAENFINKLCTGLAVEMDSSIFVLRKKLFQDKTNKAKLPVKEKNALIVKAWNSFRKDQPVKILRWNKETENFPEIV